MVLHSGALSLTPSPLHGICNMKELHPGSVGRSEVRVLFAFGPKRMAILLIAGDKAGSWTRWHKRNVPLADDLFDKHIRALRKRPEK